MRLVISAAAGDQKQVTVASDGDGYLVAWTDRRPDAPGIRGARVSAAGAQVGIPFAFDKVTRQPNTIAAHSLIMLAADAGLEGTMAVLGLKAFPAALVGGLAPLTRGLSSPR